MKLHTLFLFTLGLLVTAQVQAKEELCIGKITKAKSLMILDLGKSIEISSEDQAGEEYIATDDNLVKLPLTSFNEFGNEKVKSTYMNGSGFSIVLQKIGNATSVTFKQANGELNLLKKVSGAECVDPNEAYAHDSYED